MTDGSGGVRIKPMDEHNQRLVANTHPSEWIDPEPADRYALVVIGAGTAGLVTAAVGAALGARVALIERHLMGGDCLNVGCVPSKLVLEAARSWEAARESRDRYGGPEVAGGGDFGAVMERMRRIRAQISHHDSAERFADLGVDVFLGEAAFTDRETVRVGERDLKFRRAIIATGTRPAIPPIPGLEGAGYLTNSSIFELTELPQRLLVIGGGPIGCELAQAFTLFGSRVTVVESEPRILTNDDEEAAAVVAESLEADGVDLVLGAQVTAIAEEGAEKVVTVGGAGGDRSIRVDQILVAAGRVPNVDALGLETAGVEADPQRGVVVDERLQTSNGSVYAIGDVASRYRFTHVADAHARLVVRNALFFGRGSAEDLVIPWCTYTSPELAHVGIAPTDAEEREADVIRVDFAEVDRARLDGDERGFLKVYLDKGSDKILGATVVGRDAGDLISHFTHAIRTESGLAGFADTIFPYPTRAEVVRKAADQYNRGRLTPTVKRAMDVWFRLTT